ncbi:MAG: DNA-3-methyladenine glycosylase family protein [Gammaproteobacteria bacterium]
MELTAETFPAHALELAEQHPELGAIVERWGVPSFWTRKPGLDALVKIILEQQISIAAADTIHRRLKAALGGMSARRLFDAGPEKLRTLGLTRQKSRYCYELGRSIVERRLLLGKLAGMSDAEAIAALIEQPGIGPWTASIYVMSALGRIDVWPPGDLALRLGVAEILPNLVGDDLGDDGSRWHPRRAVAARLVWHHYRQIRAKPT